MTTIVADVSMGYMAADLQVTTNDGEVSISCDTKIQRLELGGDLYLVGFAGNEGPAEVFMEWIENGEWDNPPEPMSHLDEEDSFTAIVLGPDGLFVADKFMRLTPVHHRWYAAGSGGTYAWAILEAGCGIDKAMQVAIKMDPYSGFGYQVKYRTEHEEDRSVGT